ncbi:hypothetical protein FRC06_010342 [Ceratobasidium sp. 370]|nr:hypothetical protein FRC06_010342 [Ceratobasidium sp. 370]
MNTKRHDANYANFLPIVQSSGMGKSRTVDEPARRVFTLPFNFRPAADQTGYPKSDPGIFGRLSTQDHTLTLSQLGSRHRSLFEQLFKAAWEAPNSFRTYSSQEELVGEFRTWLLDHKESLYKKVCDECEKQDANPTISLNAGQPSAIRADDSAAAAPTPTEPLGSLNRSESRKPEELRSVPMEKQLSDSINSPECDVKATIVPFARAKLAGTQDGTLDNNGQLAVLGARVGLSFDRSRAEARLKEDRLVEGYMRVAFSIPEYREYMYADALSEPILAEAGAQLMHMNRMWDEFPRVLPDWCNTGLIAKGERGEWLARLLLTKAHDHVVRLTSPEPRPPPEFTRPILLSDFFEALAGRKNKDKILNAKPNNVPGGLTLVESVRGKARLIFTHWAKVGDSSVVTDEAAWIALGRCLAWQCFDDQSEIDLVTPLLLPPEDANLGRYTVSAIFWQIRV